MIDLGREHVFRFGNNKMCAVAATELAASYIIITIILHIHSYGSLRRTFAYYSCGVSTRTHTHTSIQHMYTSVRTGNYLRRYAAGRIRENRVCYTF